VTSSPHRHHASNAERGVSLAELLIALAVLSVGLLAVSQVFPMRPPEQLKDRMRAMASHHAQEKLAEFERLSYDDSALAPGRHPAEGLEDLGTCGRFYRVDPLGPPLDHLKRVTVTVTWGAEGTRQVSAISYVRR
jgi:prepilin-type N-terminal cleavage/methylation domain-containing protein